MTEARTEIDTSIAELQKKKKEEADWIPNTIHNMIFSLCLDNECTERNPSLKSMI